MGWKTAYRSFYYTNAEEPDDIHLDPGTTALLVIDIQHTYLEPSDDPAEGEQHHHGRSAGTRSESGLRSDTEACPQQRSQHCDPEE